jgi:hypothetical protein
MRWAAVPGSLPKADETISLVRRSHPETNRCSIRPLREQCYDRARRDSGSHFQHEHLRGSRVRFVLDALMGRSALRSADPSTIWLADLIEAMEALAATAEPCHPAMVRVQAFRVQLASPPPSGSGAKVKRFHAITRARVPAFYLYTFAPASIVAAAANPSLLYTF